MLTTDVENYPGFADGILGPELMDAMEKQAARFEAEILPVTATRGRPDRAAVRRLGGRRRVPAAETVIVSTGASAKWLGVPGEAQLRGRGVSACATCDGFFFRDRELVVVGGGDTAMEEASFLTKFASKVTIVHRRDALPRLEDHAGARAREPEGRRRVERGRRRRSLGDGAVNGVRLMDTVTGEVREIATDGVFMAIGHTTRTPRCSTASSSSTRTGTSLVRGADDAHERARGLRRGRCHRRDLPSGGDRGRAGMQGRDRRRAVPRGGAARAAARARLRVAGG